MKLFAISDLHLSSFGPDAEEKPMHIFGSQWAGHWDKISEDWARRVGDGDVVLIPGDISWAMRIDQAVSDLGLIAAMPGTKLIIKGNHDYWWQSIGRVRAQLTGNMFALQNSSHAVNGFCVCGTRGWICPGNSNFGSSDRKIYERELLRLRLSLKSATLPPKVCMMHYPPFDSEPDDSIFDVLKEFKVSHLLYGHLHGKRLQYAFDGEYRGIRVHPVSCDYLDFKLKQIDI